MSSNLEKLDYIIPYSLDKSILFEGFDNIKNELNLDLSDLKDIYEVNDLLDSMYDIGCRPIVSVSSEYFNDVKKNGLLARQNWNKGYIIKNIAGIPEIVQNKSEEVIRGSFGISPYLPENESRNLFLLDIPRDRINPVYSGPNHSFNGVIQISGNSVENNLLIEFDDFVSLNDKIEKNRSAIKAV